jgi:hypothetical protein
MGNESVRLLDIRVVHVAGIPFISEGFNETGDAAEEHLKTL